MSLARRAAKRDSNEQDIVDALEAIGATVTRLSGEGLPDLLVGLGGSMWLLEVKQPLGPRGGKRAGGASQKSAGGDGVLTEDQRKWWAEWKGPVAIVVRSPDEAVSAVRKTKTKLKAVTFGSGDEELLARRMVREARATLLELLPFEEQQTIVAMARVAIEAMGRSEESW
jgi:hypothetical protein